jgi:hypothetical protein
MKAHAILFSSCWLAIVAVACSGAPDTDLFEGPAASQNGTEPSPGAGQTPTSPADGSSSDASLGPDGSSSSNANDAGAGKQDSGASDAGAADAGWKSPGVFCGASASGASTYCTVATKLCCATLDQNYDMHFACVASGANACKTGRPLRCDDRSDCPGSQVCCATFEQGFGYRSSACQPSCTPPGTGLSSVRLCDRHAPVDECIAIGRTCGPSQSLDGFSYCQ